MTVFLNAIICNFIIFKILSNNLTDLKSHISDTIDEKNLLVRIQNFSHYTTLFN